MKYKLKLIVGESKKMLADFVLSILLSGVTLIVFTLVFSLFKVNVIDSNRRKSLIGYDFHKQGDWNDKESNTRKA